MTRPLAQSCSTASRSKASPGRRCFAPSPSSTKSRVCSPGRSARICSGASRTPRTTSFWHALAQAQAADFVRQKPKGLDEPVEQGGANFSGGQKQRLTIARTLLTGADILILDDSASALDYATDVALRHSLKALPAETTVFLVSQRAGSMLHADRILVLDDGRLIGNGTHGELLKTCEIYREIYESQFKTEAEA